MEAAAAVAEAAAAAAGAEEGGARTPCDAPSLKVRPRIATGWCGRWPSIPLALCPATILACPQQPIRKRRRRGYSSTTTITRPI